MHAKLSNQSQVFVGTYEISPNASIVEIIELLETFCYGCISNAY